MNLWRTTRRSAALLALAGMLFNQLAVAAYACPNLALSGAPAPGAMSTACEQLDAASPNLCLQHCKKNKQSLDQHQVPSVAPVLMPLYSVMLPQKSAPRPRHALVVRDFLAHDIAPPLAIQHCSFRT